MELCMHMYVIRLAAVFTVGSALLASSACGAVSKAIMGPCGVISHELASLEGKSDGRNRYSADDAPAFRHAAGEIENESLYINGEGGRVVYRLANELEAMAAKLEKLAPGEKAVYVVRGSKEEDLPAELRESCKNPSPEQGP
jgi:hypothetical protein